MTVVLIFLLVFGSTIGGVLYVVFRELRKQTLWTEATRRALASGQRLPAVIRSVGPSTSGRLVFTIGLELRPDEAGEPLLTTIEVLVPAYANSAIAPGKQVMARYDRASGVAAIDFAAMGYTSPV